MEEEGGYERINWWDLAGEAAMNTIVPVVVVGGVIAGAWFLLCRLHPCFAKQLTQGSVVLIVVVSLLLFVVQFLQLTYEKW